MMLKLVKLKILHYYYLVLQLVGVIIAEEPEANRLLLGEELAHRCLLIQERGKC